MTSNTEKTNFLHQLRNYGFKKILKSWDFKFAVGLLVLLCVDYKWRFDLFNLYTDDSKAAYLAAILAASASLFALTITALSIVLSFSSSKFVKFLHQKSLLADILFPFWLGNGAYLLTIGISAIYLILGSKFDSISDYILIGIISIFFYALASTFYLLATIVRFGFFISYYEESKDL